jgi:hypothetical protein
MNLSKIRRSRSRIIKAEIEIERLVRVDRDLDLAKIHPHRIQAILDSHLTDLRRRLCREEK